MVEGIRPEGIKFHPTGLENIFQSLFHFLFLESDFSMQIDTRSAHRGGEIGDNVLSPTMTDNEIGAPFAQILTEFMDPLNKEASTILGSFVEAMFRPTEMTRVEAEDGEDGRRILECIGECEMIVEPEVGAEERNGGAGSAGGTGWRREVIGQALL